MIRSEFSIRPAVLDDAPRVTALLAATYPREFARCYSPELLQVALPLMTRANPQLLASGTFYVAEHVNGTIAACGGWTPTRPGTGEIVAGLGHIRHFATHPDWARQGLGRALLSRCANDAQTAGIRTLECLSSLVAESFYRAMGFKAVRPFEVELTREISMPVVLMHREIQSA